MVTKDLSYRLTADERDLNRGFKSASASASAFERELAKLEARQARVHSAMEEVGRGMLVAGAAISAGLALATRAAIQWESAWTGVAKVVDGTPAQLSALEDELRDLATQLPQTHTEIAATAAAAAQLGVAREDVADFTRVMLDMGTSTNLSAEEASFALARMMNIMQTAPDDVSRLGSAIVELGNTSATTEQDIVEMALRIAGAGHTIGLTEAQVLGFGAALSSVGIRAEAGGTAISRVFLEIDSSVSQGGDTLETFARTAGMTVDEFRRAYQEDAGAAIAEFISGLGRVQESGGDVNQVLAELGLTEIRVSDALRRMSGAGELLTRTLQTGTAAWEDNVALAEEAERRYQTTEARIQIARNQLNDFAIDLGQTFLPVAGEAADLVGNLAAVIGDLPGPVKTALGVVAGLTAAVALAGGTALIAVPKIAAFRAALDTLQESGGRTATAVSGFRRVVGSVPLGPLGAALGVATIALGVFATKQAETRGRVRELTETLNEQTGAVTDNTRVWVANELETRGVLAAAQRLGLDLETVTDAVLGDSAALAEVSAAVSEYNLGLGELEPRLQAYRQSLVEQGLSTTEVTQRLAAYRSELEANNADVDTLRGAVSGLGGDVEAAQQAFERKQQAVEGDTAATEELEPATRHLAEAMGLTAGEAEEAADAVSELNKELDALFGQLFDVEAAQDAAAEAMKRVKVEAEEAGTRLRGNSEEALRNRDNVRALIRADFDLIQAMADAGAGTDEMADKTESLRERFVEQMLQAGFSEEAVLEYAAAYDEVPELVKTAFQTPGLTEAERRLRNLRLNIDNIPRNVDVSIAVNTTSSHTAPRLGTQIGFQHGGEVQGPPGIDRVPIMATAEEFVVRRDVARPNLAALRLFNATGRFPVGGGSSGSASSGSGLPDTFVATAVIDLGEGIERAVTLKFRRHDRDIKRRLDAGVGVLA